MSKELEALKKIGSCEMGYINNDKLIKHIFDTVEYGLLLKALTPPTADEVCKALSEQLKQKVSYGAKQFYYKIENTECVMFVTETYGDGLWSINAYLPPHLITLIGRFYEGVEHERD